MFEEHFEPSIYLDVWRLVSSFILKNSGDMNDVQDIIHEGFNSYLEAITKRNIVIEKNPVSYIFTSCKNFWLKELNKRQKTTNFESDQFDEVEDETESLLEKERKEQLAIILERNIKLLDSSCQKLLQYKMEGLSCAEIAGLLGLKNRQSVKSKYYHCKAQLKEYIAEDPEYRMILKDE